MNLPPVTGVACKRIKTPDFDIQSMSVVFEGPRISRIASSASRQVPAGAFDAQGEGLFVKPGLIDVHVHGAGGIDFQTADSEGLETISHMAARGGATTVIATIGLPSDDEKLERLTELVRLLKSTGALRWNRGMSDQIVSSLPGARIGGIHLEGPFLNPKRRGSFADRSLRMPDSKVAEKVMEICEDVLTNVTLAPEISGGEDLIDVFTSGTSPVEVSSGHTAADIATAMKGFENPHARQVTHILNAMSGLHHRQDNLITSCPVGSQGIV